MIIIRNAQVNRQGAGEIFSLPWESKSMVLHQPPAMPLVFRLSALSAYSTWGELLAGIRKHNDLTQQQIATASEAYFIKAGMPLLKPRIYGDMERRRRAPSFQELEPLFRTFVEVYGVEFSDLEITAYVHLAKERMAQKSKRKDRVDETQWETLTETLFRINQSKRSQNIYLLIDAPTRYVPTEDPASRRLKAVEQALRTDTSHLLERDEWGAHMLAYAETSPQRKLVVIQGHMGTGKSHALALLIQRFVQESPYYLIPYLFEAGESKTPEDQLEVFLATIVADLMQTTPSDEMKQKPLEAQIDQVLAVLKAHGEQGQKVILLLDDAQVMFSSATQWCSGWAQFFEALVREPHTTTLYMMTRTWPGWEDRRFAYIEETELPELSAAASVAIWRRSGFDDVPEQLLRKISHRYGYNPQLIEMSIAQCKKRSCTFAWRKGGEVSSRTQKNPNTQRLEDLLAQDTLFDRMNVKARAVLQHSLTSRLSHQAVQMLECLALSPLGLPFTLLIEEFACAEEALNELASASAIDLNAAAVQRAAIVPLVREAQWQSLMNEGRQPGIEQRVTDLYTYWLTSLQEFRDDAEKAGLIAEMVVRYVKVGQMLKAADLFISYGWLCALFGHIARIQRVYEEVVAKDRGKEMGNSYDVGELFFLYHLPTIIGEKVNPRTRDTDFQHIHNLVLENKVVLNPHPEVYLAYTLMLRMVHEKRYQDAYDFLQDAMNRVAKAGKVDPEVRASFLHNKANLLGRWSSHSTEMNQVDEAIRLQSECVDVLAEVIKTWRACLRNSLPIQERYYHFKLARALNDLAYYSRKLGHLNNAEQAIIECLYLKEEKKATLPRSLAVSLGEYAQILKAHGRYQEADVKNAQAIQHIEKILQSGDSSAHEDKGMLLVERANIYEMQGRLDEAKSLLRNALSLLGEDRDAFRFEAEQQLTRIQVMEESSTHYQMDSRWYARYLPLAQYDDLTWLAQAGPFTAEELHTWDQLYTQRREPEIWQQLAETMKQSRQREFELSAVEGRLPHILYPAIDIDDVCSRIRGFSKLKETIKREEANAVVRRLYERKIEEHLLLLRLVEATYKQDIVGLCTYNEALYGKISKAEMTIALREFFKMLRRAQNHPQAKELVEQILQQLKQWHLFAEDFITSEDEAIKRVLSKKLQQWRRSPVSSCAVQHFYEEALKFYGFAEWQIILSPERDGISLDLDLCHLYLPTNDHFTILSVAELLTEEIETHILRSVAGKRSKLALLASGTYSYLPTEEGLAALAIEEMMDAQGLGQKSNSWTTTLSPGMAAGVLTPPQSFGSLYDLFAKAFLANHLQSGRYETLQEADAAARYDALVRISRTFRGIPDLEATGVCNLKDRVYLQGYREVSDTLTKIPKERLYVGSISIHDLADMEELHILQPAIKPLYLAHDLQLFDKIMALEKQQPWKLLK